MTREEFIDNLRVASRLLVPSAPNGGHGVLHSADLWLTPKSVDGFDSADFQHWPEQERETLQKEVAAFLAVAQQVAANMPASKTQRKQARQHLEAIIKIVRGRVLAEWLQAQIEMMDEATTAAKAKGWYVERDDKDILESLLGAYKAPRLRIRTRNNEVVLDPIARFGSGRQGIVDLVVMPTYETAYLLTFKNGAWEIVSQRGTFNKRPLTQATLVNTITKLPHA